jgi:hypothetical protein
MIIGKITSAIALAFTIFSKTTQDYKIRSSAESLEEMKILQHTMKNSYTIEYEVLRKPELNWFQNLAPSISFCEEMKDIIPQQTDYLKDENKLTLKGLDTYHFFDTEDKFIRNCEEVLEAHNYYSGINTNTLEL